MESTAWLKRASTGGRSRAVTSSCLVLFVMFHAVFLNAGCTSGFSSADLSSIMPTPTPTGSIVDDGTWGTSLTESPLITWQSLSSANGIDRYEVAVGTTAGETDVLTWTDNGRSLSRRLTGLSLTEGSRYYASVRLIDSKGNAGTVFKGDGWTVDSTPPLGPSTLDDGSHTTSLTSSPSITWSASTETGSGLAKYELAVGTAPGISDVVTWTDVGLPSTRAHTFTGLPLLEGKTYYASLRATDVAGNVSAVRYGNGWTVNNTLSVVSKSFAAPLDTIYAIHDGGGTGATQKRLVGGQFTVARTSSHMLNGIGRVVGVDGTRDTTFTPGVGFNDEVNAMAVQSGASHAGKVLVGGKFSRFNLSTVNRIVRLNVDGTLDTGFNASTTSTWTEVTAMAVQSDGKVIVAGLANGSTKLVRFRSDGALDSSFGLSGAGFNQAVRAIVIQSTGEVVVGGDFTTYGSSPVVNRTYVARLSSTGALDGAFVPPTINGPVNALTVLSGGSVIIAGDFTTVGGVSAGIGRVAKLSSSGAHDSSFATTGTGFNAVIRALAVTSGGKILVGGDFTDYDSTARAGLALLDTNGALSGDLNIGAGFNGAVHSLLVQPDEKIVVGGAFSEYKSALRAGIVRLDSNGDRDSDFDIDAKLIGRPTTSANPVIVRSLVRRSDATVVFGGKFAAYDNAFHALVRLDSSGVVDSSFNAGGAGFTLSAPGLVAAPTVRNIHRLSAGGKILVGGQFTSYNGVKRSGLVLLDENTGAIDTSGGFGEAGCADSGGFSKGTGASKYADAAVYGIAALGTSFIVVGDFDAYCESSTGMGTVHNYKNVIKLNADGTVDITFDGTLDFDANGIVRAVVVNSSNEIFIGGDFASISGGVDLVRAAKLDQDGTVITAFKTGTGFNDSVNGLALQSNGMLIAVGAFNSYGADSPSRIARLNPSSGALDTGFVGDCNDTIHAAYIQSNGKIVVVGNFNQCGVPGSAATRGRIARFETTGALDTTIFSVAGDTTNPTSTIHALFPFGTDLAIGGSFAVFKGGASPGNPIPSPGYAEIKNALAP